jgi:glycosyltransferase involved in cell wall biosynthesis
MPEIIAEAETGFLIPPGDTDALTERLLQLLTEAGAAKRFGDAGYSRYLERFTWDAVISKIVNQLHDERPELA